MLNEVWDEITYPFLNFNVRDLHGIVADYTGDRRISRLRECNE